MDEVEKAHRALKDTVETLRKLSDLHGSLRLIDPGWDMRLSYTLAREALSSLQKWIDDRDRRKSETVIVLKSKN